MTMALDKSDDRDYSRAPARTEPYRLLDLFSGIGGFSLGLERSGGFKTVAFCEIDPFCRRVLAKHWPEVPCYDDVRSLTAERLAADGIAVDAICGGFPCQDISLAGKGAGLAGERSGLWFEYARIVGELRPCYVIVENVGALLHRGLDAVLGSLATLGYDAEWHCIPASAVGAPHRRDRLWIIAARREGMGNAERCGLPRDDGRRAGAELADGCSHVADAEGERRGEARELRRDESAQRTASGRQAIIMADAYGLHVQGQLACQSDAEVRCGSIARSTGPRGYGDGWWSVEPAVGRVAHGVPARVDRLKSLGNAVVPQIPELIGRAILAAEARA